MRKLLFVVFLLPLLVQAQEKSITLEDIYKKGTFRGEPVRTDFGTAKSSPELKTDELKDETGKPFGQADDIVFSPSGSQFAFLKKGTEPIYRRSS
ncbi:MAG TPA: hypothetical protein PLZ10_10130, partial [Chitinophagaceae bacterium]|nr:hypothetical protein [Chitinophagaceae bacterium]